MGRAPMDDKAVFKSFFSDEEVGAEEYANEIMKLTRGRALSRKRPYKGKYPFYLFHRTAARDGIRAAFGCNPPTAKKMAELIGVPIDTLKGWMAARGTTKHREVDLTQFAEIVRAGAEYAHHEDTPDARTMTACRMLQAKTPSEVERGSKQRQRDARDSKVMAVALRAAALDEESLDLMLQLSERILSTSEPSGGFDWWGNECVEHLFEARGERRPWIEDDERGQIDRAEYFAMVKDAVRNADVELIGDLWNAQPDESPLEPFC